MDIEFAKKQNLNWQSLMVEEIQTKIKEKLRDFVLANENVKKINIWILKTIQEFINKLENEELKKSSKEALLKFSSQVYVMYKRAFSGLGLNEIIAMAMLSNGNIEPKYTKIVKNTMQKELGVIQYEWGTPLDIYAKSYMEVVEKRMNEIAKLEAKEDYKSRTTLRNIAEMQIRQENHNKEITNLLNKGVKLVWIVPHANCSKRCEPFQNKLYSLDGTYGSIDGISYRPLEVATDIYETTKSGKVYKNGCISGFGCRHILKPYKRGNKPIEIPLKEITKAREIDQKQRYFERGIRNWKDRAIIFKGIDNKKYAFAKNKAREWNERYIDYSKENEVAYYPSRTKII